MTPYADEYITLGGLILRSRAIDCHDWSDVLGAPDKVGDDFEPDQTDGVVFQDRYLGPLRAQLLVRVNSAYDQDNASVAESSRRANMYTLLEALRSVVEVTTTQTIRLTRPGGGPHEADCVVTSGFRPTHWSPTFATMRIDVLLPDGGLL